MNKTTETCDCFAERHAGEETYRSGYMQCPCCGALMSFTSEEFPRHPHITRFGDGTVPK
jgi:hypothetical protein